MPTQVQHLYRRLGTKLIEPVVQSMTAVHAKDLTPSPLQPNGEQWKEQELKTFEQDSRRLLLEDPHKERLQSALTIVLEKGKQEPAYSGLQQSFIKAALLLQKQLKSRQWTWNAAISLQEWLEISNSDYLLCYGMASELFEQNAISQASDLLLLLSFLNPHLPQVWRARGLAEQKMQRFDEALFAYGFVVILNSTDPWGYLHSADICLQQGDREQARAFMHLAQQQVNQSTGDEYQDFMQRLSMQLV